MWMLAVLFACGSSAELEAARAELERVKAENSALSARVAEQERQLEEIRPAFEAMRSLEQAAERDYEAPTERCTPDGDGFRFGGSMDSLATMDLWARSARLVPVEEPPGLRLLAIRRDSLPASCGLMNGDILLTLNGRSVGDPTAWPSIQGADALVLKVERRGTLHEIRVR